MKALLPLFLFLALVLVQIVLYVIIGVRVFSEPFRHEAASSYFPGNEAVLVPGKGADTTVVRCVYHPGATYLIRDPLEEQHLVDQDAKDGADHL